MIGTECQWHTNNSDDYFYIFTKRRKATLLQYTARAGSQPQKLLPGDGANNKRANKVLDSSQFSLLNTSFVPTETIRQSQSRIENKVY